MSTKAVHIRNGYDVYIGRAGRGEDGYFGNPFYLNSENEREEVLTKYRKWFYERLAIDNEFKQRVEQLKGKRLGCFCSPKLCHGDVISEYVNSL